MENAALKTPLKPGDISQWALGDFNEITSFAVASWREGAFSPTAVSVNAVLGRSPYPSYPALRWLGITPLIPMTRLRESTEDIPVLLLTYERADEKGVRSFFQQSISRKELLDSLVGKGPVLLVGKDPLA